MCDPLIHPGCIVTKVIPPVTSTVTGGVLDGLASAINEGIRWIVVNTATWWIQLHSPDLANEPAVTQIQAWLLPITAVVATAGVIAAGLRMALTRRANPLLDVSGGLLGLAAAVTLGVIVPALLLKAGDAWSSWVLTVSTGGHFTQRLSAILDLGGKAAPIIVVLLGIVAIITALVQAVLMLFRQLALIILAGALPLAAAGAIAPATRPWLRRVTSWMLALICYKPAAAAVYAAAFTLVGSGRSTRTILMGFAAMLLSVVMLPALMKFFTWTTGSIASSGGGGGQFLGAAALGAVALGGLRSGSSGSGAASAAQDQAAYLDSRLGPPPGGSPPPSSAGPGGSGGGPGGAAPSAATSAPDPSAPAYQAGSPADAVSSGPSASSAEPAGAASAVPSASSAAPSSATAAAATGAADASAGSAAATGAAATAATGAAAAAGPVGVAAAGAIQAGQAAAKTTARLADGAMTPEEGQQ
jgi:hypothetical protein